MQEATWYLGPLGDVRPLVCPEPDMTINEIRYGGVHQGLSGARTVDITGFRTDYQFDFNWLTRDEFLWLEALHLRLVPGPFYLLNPLKRNRLSSQASRLMPSFKQSAGVAFDGPSSVSRDWPTDLPIPGRSLKLANWTGTTNNVAFDTGKPVPVLPGETLTASVWLKSDVTYNNVKLRIAWYTVDKQFIRNDEISVAPSPDWSLHWFTYHEAPSNAAAGVFSVVLGAPTTAVYFAAPMLEAGTDYWPNEWEIGGGATLVHVDTLETTSKIFPLRNASLKLMEA